MVTDADGFSSLFNVILGWLVTWRLELGVDLGFEEAVLEGTTLGEDILQKIKAWTKNNTSNQFLLEYLENNQMCLGVFYLNSIDWLLL